MSTSPPAGPFERGLARLLRGQYSEAVAEYSEAIRLDPDAPNAYIGRAAAYRGLGEAARALQDQQAAEDLGGPERTAWDRLVNRAYLRLKRDLGMASRDEFYRRLDPLQRKALLLHELNGQILNGGLVQWVANGYSDRIGEVIDVVGQVGTDAARTVAAILEELSEALEATPSMRMDEEEPDPISEFDGRYYEVQSRFVGDVERWLEAQSMPVTSPAVEEERRDEAPAKRPWWRFWT